MSDVKLDSLGDIDFTTTPNEMTLTSGVEGIEQDWIIRIRTLLTEWFLDERIGVPYFQQILVKNPDPAAIRAIFTRVTIGTSGIKAVTRLTIDIDPQTRLADIEVDGQLENDLGNFAFKYSELILPQPLGPEA